MADVVLLTPREISTGAASLNNQNVLITDEEYARLAPVMRTFYQKVRENLGLACITAELRARGYTVAALNLHGRQPTDEAIIEFIRRARPRFVGISIMYDLHIIDAVRMVRCARRADPSAFVAVGGAFCTYNAKLIAEHLTEVDCVAFGEGELTVVDIMDRLAAGTDWRVVPGTWYRDGGGAARTSGMPRLADLSGVVWPARDTLLHYKRAGIPTPVASTYTSRGCHAKCTFCYAPRTPGTGDGPWRVRPPGDVVDEIEMLRRTFGTRFIWFNDDNFGGAFADGYAHAVAVAEEIIRRGLKLSFHAEFRVDSGLIDHDALEVLRRAGMASALLGMESGSPGMLKRFKKGTTVAYNLAAARMFAEHDIELDPGWIMIEPRTTLDELWENLHFIVASGIYRSDNPFFLINRAIALRGTELYDLVVDQPPPADLRDSPGPAREVLRESRRDYRVPDPRVEALWEVWSGIGGEIGDRKENRLPFLAQALADAIRRRRGASAGGADAHLWELLGRLRRWRSDLPQLFIAFMNLGLVLAEQDPADLSARLDSELRAMVDQYDRTHLGLPFGELAGLVERISADDRAAIAGPV
jgi:radical SAM superfamily enzyme YgiQ (UPF0313 family)